MQHSTLRSNERHTAKNWEAIVHIGYENQVRNEDLETIAKAKELPDASDVYMNI